MAGDSSAYRHLIVGLVLVCRLQLGLASKGAAAAASEAAVVAVSSAEELGTALASWDGVVENCSLVIEIEQGTIAADAVVEDVASTSVIANAFPVVRMGAYATLTISGAGRETTTIDLKGQGRFLTLLGSSDEASLYLSDMTVTNGGFLPSVYERYRQNIKMCTPEAENTIPNITLCKDESMMSLTGLYPTKDLELGAEMPLGGVIYSRGVQLHLNNVVLSNCVSIAGSGVYYSGLFTHDFLARSIYTLHVTSSVFQNMNAYLEGSSIWVTVENPMASAEVDLAITSSTFYESLTCITGELSPDDPSLASIPNQRETEDWVEDLISTMERLIDQNLTIATGQGALVVKSHTLGGKNFTAVVSDSSFERCEVGRCADELQDSQLGGAISIALTYSYQTQDIGIFDSTIANCSSYFAGGGISVMVGYNTDEPGRITLKNSSLSIDMSTSWAAPRGLQIYARNIIPEIESCSFDINTFGVQEIPQNISVIDLAPGEAHFRDVGFVLRGLESITSRIWYISQLTNETIYVCPKDTFTDQKVTFLSTRPTIEVDMDCPESPGKRHKTDSRLLVASIAFMTSAPIFLLLAIIVRRRIFLEKLGSRYQVLDSRGDVEMESAESNPVSPSASSEKKSDECTHNSPFQGLVSKGWIQFLNSVKSIMPPFHIADARDLKVESAVPIQRGLSVCHGEWKGSKVKVIYRNSSSPEDQTPVLRIQELATILSRFCHSSIARVYGVLRETPSIIMERVQGDSLLEFRRRMSTSISVSEILSMIRQVASAIYHIHSEGAVHLDIRSKHILVQSHGASLKPKITNFYNVARVSKDGQADVDISTWNKALGRYYAPEILKDMLGVVDSSSPRPIWCKASDKADVFAFALVLYEVWSGRDAFESPDSTLVQQIVDEQKRPPLDDAIFADCPWRGLILSCWHQDPLERPTMEVVCARLQSIDESTCRKTLPPFLSLSANTRFFHEV